MSYGDVGKARCMSSIGIGMGMGIGGERMGMFVMAAFRRGWVSVGFTNGAGKLKDIGGRDDAHSIYQ